MTSAGALTAVVTLIGASLSVASVGLTSASASGAPVTLASDAQFSVLAASTVTNTGSSSLSGDLGVSPGTALTGFTPTMVNGSTHSADAVAAQAQVDLTAAYNDAAAQTPTELVSADLAGQTLTPGVYNASSSMGLSGALTLNAEGNPNAVFIFQAGSTLTTASSSSVNLIGDAQDCNIYWQVGSSATLGTSTSFAGTILASASITVNNGSSVAGSALAQNGAVTLNNATFTAPTCATQLTPTTPTISNLPSSGSFGGQFTAVVSTTGDGVRSVVTSTPAVCPVSGLTVNFEGAGTCTLTAEVAAGLNYLAASGTAQHVAIALTRATSPHNVAVTAGNGSATVTWLAPTSTGGGTVSSYAVVATDTTNSSRGHQSCTVTAPNVTSCLVGGLTNGDSYTFTVQATTQAGSGAVSIASTPVTPRFVSTTTLTVSTPTVTFGSEAVETLSVVVTPGAPGGSVVVNDNDHSLCPFTLVAGRGSCSLSKTELAVGTNTLVAHYAGNGAFGASTSNTVTVTVAKIATSTTLAESQSSVVFGAEHTVKLSVFVSPHAATGTVTIRSSSEVVCTARLAHGVGSCYLKPNVLTVGAYSLVATYNGSAEYLTSTSNGENITVAKATSALSLALSSITTKRGSEQIDRISVKVWPQFAGTKPTGTVTIYESSVAVCVMTISQGKGSCTMTKNQLAVGSYQLYANYGGSANFDAATSEPETLVVKV